MSLSSRLLWFAVVALVFSSDGEAQARARAQSQPGLTRGIAVADSLIESALGKVTAGAVLVVAKDGEVVHERAFGHAELNDHDLRPLASPRAMLTTTVFDLASVTKVMATTMAMMILVDRGQVDIDAPVSRYLSDFRGPHLDSINVRHLLQHSSGLVQWQPLYYQASTKSETYRAIRDMPLGWGVGEGRHYSDLGFMLLGYIIERVSGRPLDSFVDRELYHPLGLRRTAFNPATRGITGFAATEQGNVYERHMVYDSTFGYRYRGDPASWNKWRSHVLVGETDDGNSFYANGGVAGHAGLFSTAGEIRVLLDLLNNRGTVQGKRFMRPGTVDRFLSLDRFGHYLGWQRQDGLPDGSFMHTGFTGTYVLGIPRYRLSVVLLTNRQNLGTNEKGFFPDVAPLRIAVVDAIVDGVEGDTTPRGARFETTDMQSGRWFKGNTHTHTLESDGDSPPEDVAKWYKTHGYRFLRAGSLDALDIMTQMEAGRFYASTGVELDSVRVRPRELVVHVRARGNFKFTTDFIGKGGALLARTGANPARYRLAGSETYVRARITDSGGAIAWVQPVFVER